jgi:hypothetical protein
MLRKIQNPNKKIKTLLAIILNTKKIKTIVSRMHNSNIKMKKLLSMILKKKKMATRKL